jgi:Arc/MetJ-type ribon-helix-helix transcriptional regulator
MVRTQIQLTEKQARALKELASRRDVSVAELVRQAVNLLLESAPYTDMDERRQRALAAAGRFRSERADVSERHDDYLAGAYAE